MLLPVAMSWESGKGGGVKRIRAVDIREMEYDYVIVASSAYKEIESILLRLGVVKEKIRQVYDKKIYMYDKVVREITYWNFTCLNAEYEIGNYKIDIGEGHMLPQYQMEYPMYDCFLGELSRCLQRSDWAIDIGANVGDSVFLLRKHSDIRILAVEPVSDYYELLRKNAAQLEDVFIEKYMVSMDEKKNYNMVEHGGTAYAEETDGDTGDLVPAVTMEHLLEIKGIEPEKIRMIKIDTDGFDADCIMSLGMTLKQINAFIYFENFYSNKEGHDKYEKAYDFLNDKGYIYYFIFDNFGNFLCEGNINTVKSVNHYLLRTLRGDSAKTMAYIDVLAVKEDLYRDAKNAVKEYTDIFDVKIEKGN